MKIPLAILLLTLSLIFHCQALHKTRGAQNRLPLRKTSANRRCLRCHFDSYQTAPYIFAFLNIPKKPFQLKPLHLPILRPFSSILTQARNCIEKGWNYCEGLVIVDRVLQEKCLQYGGNYCNNVVRPGPLRYLLCRDDGDQVCEMLDELLQKITCKTIGKFCEGVEPFTVPWSEKGRASYW